MQRSLFLLFSLWAACFLCLPAPDAFARRVEECGVERVNYVRGQSCPAELFFEAATSACGAATYKARSDKSCPGYVSKDVVTLPESYSPPPCPAGYRETKRTLVPGCPECNKPRSDKFVVTCERPEFIPTCRLPAFGPETYKTCRHRSHGIELRTACIQTPVFLDCDVLMTRVELDSYLAQVVRTIPVTGPLLVSNEGLIAKLSGNADALACLIGSWEDDPLHAPVITQLQSDFFKLTGRTYTPDACTGGSHQSFACAPGDSSDICIAQKAVTDARSLFASLLSEVTALRGDVVPRSNAAYRDRLDALSLELSRYLP